MSLCEYCVKGVTHEGQPTGSVEKINEVLTYVAKPTTEYDHTKAIIFCPDIFGYEPVNSRLLADGFAKNGFQTYIPDFLNGDPYVMKGDTFDENDLGRWLTKHGQEETLPPLLKLIEGLKEHGITSFAVTGYCFGGKYAFELSHAKLVKVASVSHPSLLKIPEDLEKLKASDVPLQINSCENDHTYPRDAQEMGDKILGDGKVETPTYSRAHFAGCDHGFAIRADLSDPVQKKAKEDAFENVVRWFKVHL